MVGRIARHEWRLLRADRTLWVVAVVVAATLGYGLATGAGWAASQQQTIETALAEERDRLSRLEAQAARVEAGDEEVSPFRDPRNPGVLARGMGSRYATLPPGPLAALAVGQSDLLPAYVRITSDSREIDTAAVEVENPHRLLVGRFDLAFAVIYLLPLFILALTYNTLSIEKEQGTLALTLAQPVSLASLVAGKTLARAALLVALVGLVMLAGWLTAAVDAGDAGLVVRLALWTLLVSAYAAFWFGVSAFVTSRGLGSAANAVRLAGVWLALVIVVPSLVNVLVASLYPVPSRVSMIQAIREASDEATAEGSRLLARYYEEHPELAALDADEAMGDFHIVRAAVTARVDERMQPVVEAYEAQIRRQQATVGWLRFLSPAMLAQEAISDLAGTGAARHAHFMAQVDRFHTGWRAFFTPLILERVRVLDHGALPRFHYREEALGDVVGRALVAPIALLLVASALAAAAVVRLRRFPVAG